MLDAVAKKKKKPVKVKLKEPTNYLDEVKIVLEGTKLKFSSKNKLSAASENIKLELTGSFSKKKSKIGGKIEKVKIIIDGDTVAEISNLGMPIKKLLSAQKSLKNSGDFLPLNKLFTAKPMDIKGSNGDDFLAGGLKNDKIDGKNGNDTLIGLGGNDALKGGAGDDLLDGGFGNDILDGSAGQNTLIGGPGADRFDLTSLQGMSRINDYFAGEGDKVGLSGQAFTGLGAKGPLSSGLFELNVLDPTKGATKIYLTPGGALFYDSNGNAPGGATQISQFMSGRPTSADDFIVF